MDEKVGVAVPVFAAEYHMHFLQFLREDWDEFQNGIYVEGGKKHWNICFPRIFIEISQLRCNVIEMALK